MSLKEVNTTKTSTKLTFSRITPRIPKNMTKITIIRARITITLIRWYRRSSSGSRKVLLLELLLELLLVFDDDEV